MDEDEKIIVTHLKNRGFTEQEIKDFLKREKESKAFRKKYREDHACCPKCGYDGHSTTLVAFVMVHGEYDKYKDRNDCVCSQCGDKHIAHDRVPLKNEENGKE